VKRDFEKELGYDS
jgi:hypothetical protein